VFIAKVSEQTLGVAVSSEDNADDRIMRYLEEDENLAAARRNLEAKIAELVVGAPEQWDLLGYILTEFEPAVYEANIAAFVRAFFSDEGETPTAQ
jgi:hypothetical protein